MIVWETTKRVAIVTGPSENRKTGPMFQLWILARQVHPWEAVETGADELVCGSCPRRQRAGALGDCYVSITHMGPASVWMKYHAGGYASRCVPRLRGMLWGYGLRLGAYGDPGFLPAGLVAELCKWAGWWTGYTHRWRERPDLARYCMASVDDLAELQAARAAGWRCYRVGASVDDQRRSEIMCPASEEAGGGPHHVTCGQCRRCSGSEAGADVFTVAHGAMVPRKGAKR